MSLFRFENGEMLWLLWLLPLLTVLYILYRSQRKKLLKSFGDSALINRLLPEVSGYKPIVKFTIAMLAMAFLIMGASNPQIGSKMEKVKREGVDVIIVLDVSNSMKAEDIKPNRLERAKQLVSRLIDKLINDRIGLVVFAGDAFLQLPITTDYSAAKLFLSAVDTDIIPRQGTSIGRAIELAAGSFKDELAKHKAIIVITDGENHEDDAVGAATEAAKKGIIVHTIGMGEVNGGPIPIFQSGNRVGFMKDEEGNIIVTKLDQGMLDQIASAGRGRFIRSGNTDADLNKLIEEIAKMDKKEFESKLYTDYDDKFQYFIAIALFLLIIELALSNRKNKYLASWNLFGEKKI